MQMPGVSITLDELAAETGWLRRLASSLVKDPAAADDLVQDAYVVAAAHAPRDGRPLRPWLVRVLVNLTRMQARGAGHRRAREQAVAALASAPATPAELVGRIEVHRLLAGLVLELSPASRDVVLLHYVEGLSLAAVAARLGLAAGTVRWRHKQAIDELRDRLEHREPNRGWLPALTAFAAPSPSASAGAAIPWLVFAAIALLIGVAWIVVQVRSSPTPPIATRPTQRAGLEARAAQLETPSAQADSAPTWPPPVSDVITSGSRRIEGRVVDAQQQPVADAEVTLACDYGDASAPFPRTTTSALGTFVFEVDAGCSGQVFAQKDGRMAESFVDSRFAAYPVVLALAPRLVIAVHVVDWATDAPVAGAEVSATGRLGIGQAGIGARNTATTNASGDAQVYQPRPPRILEEVAKVPSGLFVRAAGYVPAHSLVELVHGPVTYPPPVSTIFLMRGVVIRGQLRGAEAFPDATIDVLGPMAEDDPARSWTWRKGVEGDRAEPDGRFEIRVPGPGRYLLAPHTASLGPINEAETRVDVGPDGRSDVLIHLGPKEASGIAGIVVDAAGKPVAGARVTTPTGRMKPIITDELGRFTIPMGAGPYSLMARHGTSSSEVVPVEMHHGQLTHLTLPLRPAGIAGVVVDAGGTPVPGAEVYRNVTHDFPHGDRATTDAQGRFSFDVPRGTFVLSVRRSSEDSFEDEDDVTVTGGTHDLRLVVP